MSKASWYVAHAVLQITYKEGEQPEFTLWENLVLIQGKSPETAMKAAERWAKEKYVFDDPSFTCNGRPAYFKYLGIRKLMEVVEPLRSGAELTFLELQAKTAEEVELLMDGKPVLIYFEGKHEPDEEDDTE